MSVSRERHKPIAVFESDRNASVYAHYVTTRQNRAMPRREDIDPSRIVRQLPYVYMVRVVHHADGDVSFRITLMGTELVAILKQEGKDRFVRELKLGGFEKVWRESMLCCLEHKIPLVAIDSVNMSSGLLVEFEHLALPLSENGTDVDRIFGCFDFPRVGEEWIEANLDQVQWDPANTVDVPKRLLITNLTVPIE